MEGTLTYIFCAFPSFHFHSRFFPAAVLSCSTIWDSITIRNKHTDSDQLVHRKWVPANETVLIEPSFDSINEPLLIMFKRWNVAVVFAERSRKRICRSLSPNSADPFGYNFFSILSESILTDHHVAFPVWYAVLQSCGWRPNDPAWWFLRVYHYSSCKTADAAWSMINGHEQIQKSGSITSRSIHSQRLDQNDYSRTI